MIRGCHVVLPAAGIGERFKSDIPKQFHVINGKTVIAHTVQKFNSYNSVKTIVVVAPESQNYLATMRKILQPYMSNNNKISITTGNCTRHRSIHKGLKCLETILKKSCPDDWENEIVVIHDAVRPFVTEDDIEKVVSAANTHKAAGMIKPLVSTVISMDEDDTLDECLDRSKFWASEMPQAFHVGTILKAYGECSEYELDHGTECLQVVFKYGRIKPKLIRGDADNLWKITHKRDIIAATAMLGGE